MRETREIESHRRFTQCFSPTSLACLLCASVPVWFKLLNKRE